MTKRQKGTLSYNIPIQTYTMIPERTIGAIQHIYDETKNISETARRAGVSRWAVKKYVAVGPNPRKGYTPRPKRESTKRRHQLLRQLVKQCVRKGDREWPRYGSAKQLQRALLHHGVRVSRRQVSRDLNNIGYKSYVRPTCPTRRSQDRARRRAFARSERGKPWRRLVFSDETWLTCNETTGRTQWATKRSNVLPRERRARWNVASVMVWGAFGHNFKSQLVVFPAKRDEGGIIKAYRLDSKAYVRRCLAVVVPQLKAKNKTLLHDGARSHAAEYTTQYLLRKRVSFLANFPPYSPDLNMIEPLWKTFAERVGETCPMTVAELTERAKIVWNELPQSLLNRHASHFEKALRRASKNR